jgi:glycerol-3-phosphate acyltransferase PlsX
LLDLGANIGCDAGNLVQFAMMGDAFAKVVLGKESPTVALLNVGEEETKGSAIVKAAYDEITEGEYPLNFIGYVEGDGIVKGEADVVVTDGFTGNVALKVAEGTGKICISYIKQGFKGSPLAMLGGILAKRSMKKVFKKMDPRMHNGAMFLGLNGISVKSHGGTDGVGFANAIIVTAELARNQINSKIIDELEFYNGNFESEEVINPKVSDEISDD